MCHLIGKNKTIEMFPLLGLQILSIKMPQKLQEEEKPKEGQMDEGFPKVIRKRTHS
jgi:hypothetical protein